MQLSLFLDDFDLSASVAQSATSAVKGSEVEDLFGFSDEQHTTTLLSDGATAPIAERIELSALDDGPETTTGDFSPVVPAESETSPAEQRQFAPLQIGKRTIIQFTAREQAPWPRLRPDDIADLGGDVGKFDNNIAAINMVAKLEAEGRQPTHDERLVLHRYTGWGGLKDAIEGRHDWTARREVLKNLLTESELKTARDSVLNAHYTEVEVVNAVWAMVQKLGFKGGRVIDPAAGTGHFFGAMPEEIAKASDLYAVEIDSMSARIHRALYGHACRLEHSGFEDVDYPSGWFDLAITNVPFGNYPLPCTKRKNYSRWNIHNYFLAKSLDLVRPGGLVAIITSTFTLDASDEKRRTWFRNQAELVAAVRLPTRVFKRMANTDVSADILIFRRREATERPKPQEPDFISLATLEATQVKGVAVPAHLRQVNHYWIERPGHVLGEWTGDYQGRYSGYKVVVEAPSGQDLAEAIGKVIETLPSARYIPVEERDHEQLRAHEEVEDELRNGSMVVHNGKVFRVSSGRLVDCGLPAARMGRARGLIEIRDHTRSLLKAQIDPNSTDEALDRARKELNRLYDTFVDRWGWISSRSNSLAFRHDPDWPLLLALEHYDDEKDSATKAAIFTERTTRPVTTPTRADTPEAAALISMAECGRIDPLLVSQLLGTTEADAMEKLMESDLVFIDPRTRQYVARDEYLSGNVREKLSVAQRAGEAYQRNVAALKNVIPEDILPGDIETRLGVNWVAPADYLGFIRHLAGDDAMRYASNMDVVYDALTGAWSILNRLRDTAFDVKWGTKDISAFELMVESMNGRSATVRDPVLTEDGGTVYVVNVEKTAAARERQQLMNEEFTKWLWADAERSKRLVRKYNDEYNAYVERMYDGSYLTLPGYSWYLPPSAHQLNGVSRIMSGANVLLAHSVGAGKTLTMACGSMELRRLGLRSKLLHVVPNHMLEQYAAEFVRAYPMARLLIARKEDLQRERRKEFVARVALGNWDAVVMTHSTFERVPADPVLTKKLMDEMLDEISASLADAKRSKEDRVQVKQLVRLEKLWKAKLETLSAVWKKDDFFSLSDLGVDHLFYDEAHLAKNLVRISQMGRVAGLSNNDSQRAFDLFVKTRQMNAMHGGAEDGVVLATGTPLANSMAELHVMQRLVQPQTLRRHNLESFDSWAAMFGRVVTSLEVSPDGATFRMAERFAQFVNLPELMTMFRQVADIQTKEMLKLPTPPLAGGEPLTIVCKPSDELKQYIAKLVKRAEAIRNRLVKPDEDNMLVVTNDGRLAALDLRMVEPSAKFDPNGKIGACIAKTYELWKQSSDFLGTQLIFCDVGTPGSTPLDVYAEIKNGLIYRGIPEDQIAFIHDAKTDAAKAALFKSVREGRVRVLLASTLKGGVGTNVQTRLYALHELDVPWRPCDVEQREGRIERRGNLCESIHIIRYVTEGSFDAYSWQTLSAKQGFIAQVMAPNTKVRKMQDISMTALSYEEVKAIACGNPLVKEKAQLDTELKRLEMLYSHHCSSVRNAKWEMQAQQSHLKEAKKYLAAVDSDNTLIRDSGEVLVLEQQAFHGESEEACDALQALREAMSFDLRDHKDTIHVGTFAGLRLAARLVRDRNSGDLKPGFALGNDFQQEGQFFQQGSRAYKELARLVAERVKDRERLVQRIEACERAIPVLEVQTTSKFDHLDRMNEVRKRINILELELGLIKDEAGTEGVDESLSIAAKSALSGVAIQDVDVEEEAVAG